MKRRRAIVPAVTNCDLLVIGGGITGLGIARLAARIGCSCVLFERGELASGASSRSRHMLHGGLRYLEHGRIRLVRESLHERAALHRMAPSLTRRYKKFDSLSTVPSKNSIPAQIDDLPG